MKQKTGRNDPCPCGSGRKYKHCCGQPAAPAAAEAHDGAVERALAWLVQHHRKAFAAALEEAIDEAVYEILGDGDDAREALTGLGEALWQQVQLNLTEWLLAEGDMLASGAWVRVSELLLGPKGPLLTTGQRAWLEQLARRPLRLYVVTEVVPGASLTLCDAVDTERPPQVVIEHSASRSLRPGMQLGARVMEADGQHVLSGAIYPFSAFDGRAVLDRLQTLAMQPGPHVEDDILMAGLEIIESWLAQYLAPAPSPQIVHAASGEPLLFVTEHYEVRDWPALAAALAAQPDVQGDREAGWDRLLTHDDGLTRPQATITPQPGGRRVALRYPTAGLAEQGRAWFDALAGDSVTFQLREVSDPIGALSNRYASGLVAQANPTMLAGVDAAALAEAVASAIQRSYANWADEPIPALADRTPRQAMQSAAGLERVKGLLRSYEDGEVQQAAQQGRSPISYQFLWDALGLQR